MTKINWVMKINVWIAPAPIRPGVWRRREGGFLVRGRARDPRSNRRIEFRKVVTDTEDPDRAYAFLREQLQAVRERGTERHNRKLPSFRSYALSLMERKITRGKLKSGKSRERWASVLANHLEPVFGDFSIDQIRKPDVEAWLVRMGRKVQSREYSPNTVNDWLSLLRVILNAAVADFELERNAVALIEDLDKSEHHTYTPEQPNSLTAEELPTFLAVVRARYPQYFAMVALGFATGLRPSSMRPLRRSGDHADVIWDAGILHVRRSQTRKTVMETTKTGVLQQIGLPSELMDILRWHVAELKNAPKEVRDSELLFPSDNGGFRAASCLDRPFADVVKKLKLKKHITSRAMRRTFNDLCRRAEVRDVVTRSISGHLTEEMQRHYSTVAPEEQRQSLAKVVSLAGFRAALLGGVQDHAA